MPRFENYKGNDPVEFVINQNNNRRHQTINERAVAAAKLANLKLGDVASQKHGAPIGVPIITRDEAAKRLGVGKGTRFFLFAAITTTGHCLSPNDRPSRP